jgi:hypothetical protein
MLTYLCISNVVALTNHGKDIYAHRAESGRKGPAPLQEQGSMDGVLALRDTNFSAPTIVHEFVALASEAAEAPQNELARIVLRGAVSLSRLECQSLCNSAGSDSDSKRVRSARRTRAE